MEKSGESSTPKWKKTNSAHRFKNYNQLSSRSRMDLEAKPNVIKILLRNPHLNNFSKSTLALTLFEEFQFSFSYVWLWQEKSELSEMKTPENLKKILNIFNKKALSERDFKKKYFSKTFLGFVGVKNKNIKTNFSEK